MEDNANKILSFESGVGNGGHGNAPARFLWGKSRRCEAHNGPTACLGEPRRLLESVVGFVFNIQTTPLNVANGFFIDLNFNLLVKANSKDTLIRSIFDDRLTVRNGGMGTELQ